MLVAIYCRSEVNESSKGSRTEAVITESESGSERGLTERFGPRRFDKFRVSSFLTVQKSKKRRCHPNAATQQFVTFNLLICASGYKFCFVVLVPEHEFSSV